MSLLDDQLAKDLGNDERNPFVTKAPLESMPLETTMRVASEKPATQVQQADSMARKANVPYEVAETAPKDVQQQVRINERDWEKYEQENPRFARYMRNDPQFATMAQDEVDSMGLLDRSLAYLSVIGDSTKRGYLNNKFGELATKRAAAQSFGIGGDWTDEDEDELQAIKAERDAIPHAELGFWEGVIPTGMESATTTGEAIAGGIVGARIGAVAGPWGAFAGGLIGAGYNMFQVEGGMSSDEFRDMTDADGNKPDRKTADQMAFVAGGIKSTLEYISLRVLGKMLPDSLTDKFVKRQIRNIAKDRNTLNTLGGVVRSGSAVVGTETVTEGAQQATDIALGELLKVIDVNSFPDATYRQAFQTMLSDENIGEVLAAARGGAQGGLFFAGVGGTVGGVYNAIAKDDVDRQVSTEQDGLDTVASISEKSTLKQNNPERFNQFVSDASDDAVIYIESDIIHDYLDGVKEPDEVTEKLSQLLDESEIGGDVELSVADFASMVTGTAHDQALRGHMRLTPESVSKNAKLGHLSETKAFIQRMIDKNIISEDDAKASKKATEKLMKQLVKSGRMNRKNAGTAAKLYQMRVAVMSNYPQFQDMSFEEIYKEIGLSVDGDISQRADEAGVVPPSLYEQNQDLSAVTLPEQEYMLENGERVTIQPDAQKEWNTLRDRRQVADVLMGCING